MWMTCKELSQKSVSIFWQLSVGKEAWVTFAGCRKRNRSVFASYLIYSHHSFLYQTQGLHTHTKKSYGYCSIRKITWVFQRVSLEQSQAQTPTVHHRQNVIQCFNIAAIKIASEKKIYKKKTSMDAHKLLKMKSKQKQFCCI